MLEAPQIPGVKAPAYWWALLTMAWNTALRRGTLFALRFDDVDWAGHRLVIPAERMKARRPLVLHLNQAAMVALRSIRTDRDFVFRLPGCEEVMKSRFYKLLHRLQNLAAIPRKDHFGLHDIHRAVATTMWESSPAAAQFSLGHTRDDITRKHDVDGGPLVARALDALPQPFGFNPSDPSMDAAA
jgi:integrase